MDDTCACQHCQPDPLRTVITALQVARLSMYRLAGYPATTVTDMINAINDIIEGAEELQNQ